MQPSREFVTEITACQRRLQAFIRTLVYDPAAIEEVLQETNLALWEQAERFEPGTSFMAWACRVAWFKVLEQRRAVRRRRFEFSPEVLESIAAEALEDLEMLEQQERALTACVAALPERHRQVLEMHYFGRMHLEQIGATIDRKANAVAQLLFRIRKALRECIERRLVESPA
jgi:RNA polymerase sigma-70 factor (ECF subfamily)